MISSVRSSSIASIAATNGSGCAICPWTSSPSERSLDLAVRTAGSAHAQAAPPTTPPVAPPTTQGATQGATQLEESLEIPQRRDRARHLDRDHLDVLLFAELLELGARRRDRDQLQAMLLHVADLAPQKRERHRNGRHVNDPRDSRPCFRLRARRRHCHHAFDSDGSGDDSL